MRKLLLATVALATGLSAAATSATAGEFGMPDGMYVGAQAGFGWSHDTDIKDKSAGANCVMCNDKLHDDSGTSPVVGLTVGYQPAALNKLVRGEFELSRRWQNEVGTSDAAIGLSDFKGEINNTSLMLNAYLDCPTGFYGITPYVGAGMGVAFNDFKGGHATWNGGTQDLGNNLSTQFAWQVMTGISYPATKNVTLDLGYRYTDLGKYRSGATDNADPIEGHLRSSEVVAGVRYGF